MQRKAISLFEFTGIFSLLAFVNIISPCTSFGTDKISVYSQQIRINPKNTAAYILRAEEYINKEPCTTADSQKAVQDCSKAIQLGPISPVAYAIRGTAYQSLK